MLITSTSVNYLHFELIAIPSLFLSFFLFAHPTVCSSSEFPDLGVPKSASKFHTAAFLLGYPVLYISIIYLLCLMDNSP